MIAAARWHARRFARRRALAAAVAACAAGACTHRVATHPAPVSARENVRAFTDSLLAQPEWRNAHWGVLIVDPSTGDTLYSRNAGKLFMPASNQKILTGATALAQLGTGFRFTTRFATNGTVRDGTLDGDLIVIGRGDPTFSDALRGDWTIAFREMADSLAAHGVRRVAGAIRRGGDAFPDDKYGYGWELDDLDEDYGAPVDELFVNEGIAYRVASVGPKGYEAHTVVIKDPPQFFLDALRDALAQRGIATGAVDARVPVPTDGLHDLFAMRSLPLPVVLARMLKPSQNQIAEILFKTVGLEKTGVGSADSGRRVVERQLVAWGADTSWFAVRDGSGMSRHDYVTPETIVRVLRAMQQHPDFAAFYDGLPIAGFNGSIEGRMKGTPAERNVHAKTGTIDKVRTLSGYVTTADGHQLIFTLLCNNFTVPNRRVEALQDTLLARLAATRLGAAAP